jgi:hypothetical protein
MATKIFYSKPGFKTLLQSVGLISLLILVADKGCSHFSSDSDDRIDKRIDAKINDDRIDKRIDAKLNPLNTVLQSTLTSLQPSISLLGERIAKIEGQLMGMQRRQNSQTKLQLLRLDAQIQGARQTKTRIDAPVISNLARTLQDVTSSSPNKEISNLAWHTTMQLLAYKSSLKCRRG